MPRRVEILPEDEGIGMDGEGVAAGIFPNFPAMLTACKQVHLDIVAYLITNTFPEGSLLYVYF